MNWHSIHISAQSYAEYGLIEKGINIEDAMVLEYLGYWWNNNKSEKIEINGEKYVWCDYNTLLESLVFLNSKSKVTATRKIKKLNAAGLIELYRDSKGRIFYKLTELALKVLGISVDPLSDRKRSRYQSDNGINNKYINNNIIYKREGLNKGPIYTKGSTKSKDLKNNKALQYERVEPYKGHIKNNYLNKNLNKIRGTTMAKQKKKEEFIEQIWELFKRIYKKNRGEDYLGELTGKERSGIGKLVAYVRKELKNRGAEDCWENLHFTLSVIFTICICVPDKFLRLNVSPMFIYSKFNQYMQYRNIQGFDDVFRGLHPLEIKAMREKQQQMKNIQNEAQKRADKIKKEIEELEKQLIPANIDTPFRRWYVQKNLMDTKYGAMLDELRWKNIAQYYKEHPEIFQLKAEIIRRNIEDINAKYKK